MSDIPTLPPGSRQHPFVQLLRYSFRPFAFLEDCARAGETFSFRLTGFGTLVMLTRPEDIREVFRGDARILHAGEGNQLLATLVGETSVLVLDEEPHARQRRLLLPPLKGERMRNFFDAMQGEAVATAEDWIARRDVRADVAMQRVTLRVILHTVLGVSGGPVFDELEQSMSRLLNVSRHPLVLILYNLFPPARFKNSNLLPFYRLRRRLDAKLHDVIIAQRKLAATERPPGLLSDLLGMVHEDDTSLSDQEIRDAVVTILAAGHDTTALALAWALEQIVARADVMTRIGNELAQVCGGDLPRAEHIGELEYLDACIRESLRVRNILPFVVRVLKDELKVGGVSYPAGVVLCPAIHLLHQRDDLYPEPRAFRPERFLERRFAAHEWTPFGGGNRACLGQAFALYEMKVVLATLFSRLEMVRPRGAVSRQVRRGIAIGPGDGTRLLVAERRRV